MFFYDGKHVFSDIKETNICDFTNKSTVISLFRQIIF